MTMDRVTARPIDGECAGVHVFDVEVRKGAKVYSLAMPKLRCLAAGADACFIFVTVAGFIRTNAFRS